MKVFFNTNSALFTECQYLAPFSRYLRSSSAGYGENRPFSIYYYYCFIIIIIIKALRFAAVVLCVFFLIWPPPRDLSIARLFAFVPSCTLVFIGLVFWTDATSFFSALNVQLDMYARYDNVVFEPTLLLRIHYTIWFLLLCSRRGSSYVHVWIIAVLHVVLVVRTPL